MFDQQKAREYYDFIREFLRSADELDVDEGDFQGLVYEYAEEARTLIGRDQRDPEGE